MYENRFWFYKLINLTIDICPCMLKTKSLEKKQITRTKQAKFANLTNLHARTEAC